MKNSHWLAIAFWATVGVGMVLDSDDGSGAGETTALLVAVTTLCLMFLCCFKLLGCCI